MAASKCPVKSTSSPGLKEPRVFQFLVLPVLAGLLCSSFAGHVANPAPSATSSGLPRPAPRRDAWQVIGPGGGGTMILPTISPHDPNIVVEHCDMTGAYVTTDGGLSWRMFNLKAVVNTFAFDPREKSVIYAGNAALWRSDDTGKTWRMIFPDPAKNTIEHMRGDHAEFLLTSDDPAYPPAPQSIAAIAVDPGDSNRIYIVFEATRNQPASLFLSSDHGQSWRHVTNFARESIHALYVQPSESGEAPGVYVIGESGVYRMRGGEWRQENAPEGGKIRYGAIGRVANSVNPFIYATTATRWMGTKLAGGVYTSDDGGETWQSVSDDLARLLYQPGQGEAPRLLVVACSAHHCSTAYLGFEGLRSGSDRASLFNGVAKTTDEGRHWALVHAESNRPDPHMQTSWIENFVMDNPSQENVWFDTPYSLGVAPSNPAVVYATDLFRTYHSTDGGNTWQQVNSMRAADECWTTRGLDVTTSYGVQFDPFDARHMFVDYTDIGLFQSTNGGECWTVASRGVPARWRNTAYWLAFDPKVKGLLWGAFSGTHDLPRPKMWRRRDPERYHGGVAISTDGGMHWQPSNTRMPESAVTHILLDPTSPVGSRTLYACGFGRGVYKSVDNGKTWTLKNDGIEKKQPLAWRLTRANDGTVYLVLARRSEDGSIGNDQDGALYKSTDDADHWVKMHLPEGTNGPTGLTLDPTDNRRMYLSAWGAMTPGGDTGGGVFLSTDGGQSWKNIFSEGQHVYDVTVDLKNPRVLYLCGFDAAAYRSDDRGQTWKRIRGYNFKWGHRVILDPLDPAKIYITTFGGSVWHGPALGDPAAIEDTITRLKRGR